MCVELYADPRGDGDPVRQAMRLVPGPADPPEGRLYRASVPADRPADDFTARLIPRADGAAIPLENGCILWQR